MAENEYMREAIKLAKRGTHLLTAMQEEWTAKVLICM